MASSTYVTLFARLSLLSGSMASGSVLTKQTVQECYSNCVQQSNLICTMVCNLYGFVPFSTGHLDFLRDQDAHQHSGMIGSLGSLQSLSPINSRSPCLHHVGQCDDSLLHQQGWRSEIHFPLCRSSHPVELVHQQLNHPVGNLSSRESENAVRLSADALLLTTSGSCTIQ